jgi:hypothetical protein
MLIFNLIPILVALPTTQDRIVRFDRTDYRSHEFTHQWFKPEEKVTVRKELNRLTADQAFRIDLTCSGVTQTQCNFARQALQNSGRRIAQVLDIRVPVTVKAQYFPFCPANNKQCEESSTLGGAVYGSAFAATKEGDPQLYMFPQALVKQLNLNENLQFSDSDIIAQFNADFPYFFRNSGTVMSPTLTDFEYVAVHEITHGLGFGTGLLEYSSVYRGRPGYLAPGIFGADENAREFSFLNPLDVFDSFMRGSDQFSNTGRQLARLSRVNARSIREFVERFEGSGEVFRNAQGIFQASTRGSNSVRFVPQRGSEVIMYTPSRYEQGSSLSHVDSRNSQTADFLMIPALAAGVTLESLMERTRSNSIYGPGTMAMLQSIGWSSNGSPTQSIRVVRNFGAANFVNPLAGSASSNSVLLSVLVCIAMLL